MRLVSPAGEPIIEPRLRRRLFDMAGKAYSDATDDRPSDAGDNDGAVTIGPLPRGIMTAALVDGDVFTTFP